MVDTPVIIDLIDLNPIDDATGRFGPPDDADPRDPNVAAYYADKQRRQVAAVSP